MNIMVGLFYLIILIGSFWFVFLLFIDCIWIYYDNKVKVNCFGRNLIFILKLNDSFIYLNLSYNKMFFIKLLFNEKYYNNKLLII